MNRRRKLGAPAPEVDLRRGWFPTQIGAADRGGQLDLKIVRGLLRGLSAALHNTASDGRPLVEKTKPPRNQTRVEWNVIAKARQK